MQEVSDFGAETEYSRIHDGSVKNTFIEPDRGYVGFSSWNNRLKTDLLRLTLKRWGWAAFISTRVPAWTPEYLSEEFFDKVKACRNHAETNDMLVDLRRGSLAVRFGNGVRAERMPVNIVFSPQALTRRDVAVLTSADYSKVAPASGKWPMAG